MKILVTGGSGYFGTRFSSLFNGNTFEIDSYDIGYFWNCWFGEKTSNPEFKLPAQEITDKLIENYDAVLHFAGISNDPLKQLNETELHDPSLEYSQFIALTCKNLGKKFIYASSCSVYGKQSKPVNEGSRVNPQTPYSQNKVQIENLLLALKDKHWAPIILRFSTLYGLSPRMRFDTVINMLCGMALVEDEIILNSNGEAMRPFIHIDDACQIIKLILEMQMNEYMERVSDSILNVGTNSANFSIKHIASVISEITFKPIKIITANEKVNELILDRKHQDGVDSRSYIVNFDRLHKLLGEKLTTRSITDGIKNTLFDLNRVGLDGSSFYDKRFYRLQFLEECIDNGVLDKKLQFIQ